MNKLDLRKEYPTYYKAKQKPELVELSQATYISIIGKGAPGGELFNHATEALYTIAYTIKFIYKKLEKDFVVSNLEGLWWSDPNESMADISFDNWNWKLLIRLPEYVTAVNFSKGRAGAKNKKPSLDTIERVILETIHEPKAIQMLHVGPYSAEPATIAVMQEFMKNSGLSQNGLHHEIYLSDPRKVKPELIKTILRIPVK